MFGSSLELGMHGDVISDVGFSSARNTLRVSRRLHRKIHTHTGCVTLVLHVYGSCLARRTGFFTNFAAVEEMFMMGRLEVNFSGALRTFRPIYNHLSDIEKGACLRALLPYEVPGNSGLPKSFRNQRLDMRGGYPHGLDRSALRYRAAFVLRPCS